MPLLAAFHFFSPFLYEKKYHIQPFSLIHFFLLFSYLSFLFSSLSCQFSFNAYIRNLALTIKNNKKLGDLIAKSPSPINTLYKKI